MYKLLDNVPEEKIPEPVKAAPKPVHSESREENEENSYETMEQLEKSKNEPFSTNDESSKLTNCYSSVEI